MYYRVKLLYRQFEATAEGVTEEQAVDRALADSFTIRHAHTPDVAVVVFLVKDETPHVSHVTRLSEWLRESHNLDRRTWARPQA